MSSKVPGGARWCFVASCLLLTFAYGFVAGRYRLFPSGLHELACEGYGEIRRTWGRPWYYAPAPQVVATTPGEPSKRDAGVDLVTGIGANDELFAQVRAADGTVVNHWSLDWFRIWPDATHLPEFVEPRTQPGTYVHGAVVLENGDLVFDFEFLGLVRLRPDGEVVWRLPYQTHHSLHQHDDGNLWVCGQRERTEPDPRFPHRPVPYDEYTLLEVTPDGVIANEWVLADILAQNGREGLLFLDSDLGQLQVRNDLLHLNDVEPFPQTMDAGYFGPGDVLVSLRNVHTIFVFDSDSGGMKFCTTGAFRMQHDPDFMDGNTISVFDNQYLDPASGELRSRIVLVEAPTGDVSEFPLPEEATFFTRIMGKHQWTDGGHLLVTSSLEGRALEIDEHGHVVWQYINYIDDDTVGMISEVTRLPPSSAEPYGAEGETTQLAGSRSSERRTRETK